MQVLKKKKKIILIFHEVLTHGSTYKNKVRTQKKRMQDKKWAV